MNIYTVKNLMVLLTPFKTTIENIKPIEFVMKDEDSLYSDECKESVAYSQFIVVVRGYPNTSITRETCISIDVQGSIITASNKIIRPGCNLFKYNETTLDILASWFKGYNKIQYISKELIRFNISELDDVKQFINELKEDI